MTYCEKKCSSDREKILNFGAEGREFAKKMRSLEQFIQVVKGKYNFWNTMIFKFVPGDFSDLIHHKNWFEVHIEKKNWDLETYRKS